MIKKRILKIILFIAGAIALYIVFFPVGANYLYSNSLLGFDSYHFLYYVIDASKNLPIPPMGWKFSWFEGISRMLDYPWLNFYLIQPLVHFVGSITAVRMYLFASLFLFLLFSYLIFWELSGSIILSLALGIALSRSWATYIQLYSSGVGLSSIFQIVFPLALFCLIKFFGKNNYKWLIFTILTTSFGFYTHPMMALFFVFIPLVLIILFSKVDGFVTFRKKIKDILLFSVGTIFLSVTPIMPFILNFVQGGNSRVAAISLEKGETVFDILDLFKSMNVSFYLALLLGIAIYFLFLIFRQKLNAAEGEGLSANSNSFDSGQGSMLNLIWPLFAVTLYYFVFQISYVYSLNPFHNTLFPHRSFWLLPVLLGMFISILVSIKRDTRLFSKITVWFLALLIIGFSTYNDFKVKGLEYILSPSITKLISQGMPKYENDYLFSKDNLLKKVDPKLALMFFPGVSADFFDTQDVNHRLYVYEMQARICWNMFYPLPMTYGYYGIRSSSANDWTTWLSTAFSLQNYEKGGIPELMAQKQALFLADWYAVRYILATDANSEADVAPHFYNENVDYVLKRTSGKSPAAIELSRDYVSEITKATNQPVLGFVGDNQSYDFFMRDLGILNLNSNYIIPIRLAEYVEDIDTEKLKSIDMIVVYNYKKKSGSAEYQQGWEKLRNYIKSGGNIYVDSGSEPPEKWGEKIPEIFPITKIESGSLGTSWNIESAIFDASKMSPLTFEGGYWSLVYAPSVNDVRSGSEILLKQSGKPVVVQENIGNGKIIWSGLNLFYRPLYNKDNPVNEAEWIRQIFDSLTPIKFSRVDFNFERPSPEKIILTTFLAHGALLKENNYGGWRAWAYSDGMKIRLPILAAGPDFMYAPLPNDLWGKNVKIEFVYMGTWYYWMFFVVSIVTLLYLLNIIIFGQIIFRPISNLFNSFIKRIKSKIKKDWNEEES